MTNQWKQPITTHSRPACPNLKFEARLPVRKARLGVDWARIEEIMREISLGMLVALIPITFIAMFVAWWLCAI